METIITINIDKLKADIKVNAEMQRFYRNQRKTVKIVGERQLPASKAAEKYYTNSEKLRAMYAAYGLVRGKNFSVTENHYPEENHPLNKLQWRIDTIMNSYQIQDKK
jgi:antitoxin component YwqK of YwqJK toxin-antitoxin module